MADHRDLVSSEVHEPRHISDSTSADSGKVITPLSGGASELRYLTPGEVGIEYKYLSAGVSQNSTSFSVTAATDPNLYTLSDYVDINSIRSPGGAVEEQLGITWDDVNYLTTIPVDGVYKLEFWANIKSDTNNSKVGFGVNVNGNVVRTTAKQDIPSLERVANISSSSLATFSAGDTVGLALACDKSASITITDLKVVVHLIRGT